MLVLFMVLAMRTSTSRRTYQVLGIISTFFVSNLRAGPEVTIIAAEIKRHFAKIKKQPVYDKMSGDIHVAPACQRRRDAMSTLSAPCRLRRNVCANGPSERELRLSFDDGTAASLDGTSALLDGTSALLSCQTAPFWQAAVLASRRSGKPPFWQAKPRAVLATERRTSGVSSSNDRRSSRDVPVSRRPRQFAAEPPRYVLLPNA